MLEPRPEEARSARIFVLLCIHRIHGLHIFLLYGAVKGASHLSQPAAANDLPEGPSSSTRKGEEF